MTLTPHEQQALDAKINKAVSDSLGRIEEAIKDMSVRLEKVETALQPLTEAYNGIIFGRKIIVGLASVSLGLAALGGAIIWIVNNSIRR